MIFSEFAGFGADFVISLHVSCNKSRKICRDKGEGALCPAFFVNLCIVRLLGNFESSKFDCGISEMELIKQIKEAEQQAKEIVETAKAGAVEIAEQGKARQLELRSQAEDERKAAIEEAIAQAEQDGQAEVEELKAQGTAARSELESKARGKMDAAAEKVMDKLKE